MTPSSTSMTEKSVPLISNSLVGSKAAEHVAQFGNLARNDKNTFGCGMEIARTIYEADRSKQLAEISTLRKSLEECMPYMQHTEGCTAIPRPFTTWKHGHDGVGYDPQTTMKAGPCTCGLSALLSQHQPEGT